MIEWLYEEHIQLSMCMKCTSTKLVCLASRTVTTAWTSSISFCFSSSSNCMYHLASLVFPARFWMRIKRICTKMGGKERLRPYFYKSLISSNKGCITKFKFSCYYQCHFKCHHIYKNKKHTPAMQKLAPNSQAMSCSFLLIHKYFYI